MTRSARLGAFFCAAALVAGCAPRRAVVEASAPSAAVASAADVLAGDGLFPFPAVGTRWGYLDRSGRVAIPPAFDAAAPFSEGRAAVRAGGLAGYIDPTGRVVVAPAFVSADPFSDGRGRVAVRTADGLRYGFVAPDGTLAVAATLPRASSYSDGLALVRLETGRPTGFQRFLGTLSGAPDDDGYAALDRDGRVAITFPYREVLAFSEGLAPVRARGGWGFVDTAGRVVVAPTFDGPAYLFTEGLARVAQGGLVGFTDTTGRLAIAPRFAAAGPFSQGLAAVLLDGRWGFADATGRLAVAAVYDAAGDFSGGRAAVLSGDRWGYIDPTGRAAIAPRYAAAQAFRNGLAFVRLETGSRAYVDLEGRVVWQETL